MQRFCHTLLALLALVILLTPTVARAAEGADGIALVAQRITASVLPQTPEEAHTAIEAGKAASATMTADGSWADVDYADASRTNWKAVDHLTRVESMIRAYLTPGQPLYQDPALKTQILTSLSYWLDRDLQNPNWWWNQISVPKHIAVIMLLMKPALSPETIARGAVIMQRSKLTTGPGLSGANLTWMATNQIMLGCVQDNEAVIQTAFSRIYQEINTDPKKRDGLRPDMSFHQHGRQLYSGGYGAAFAADCARNIVFGWGTQFQIADPQLQIFLSFVLDGQQWMMRGVRSDYSTVGREITRAVADTVPVYTLAQTNDAPLPQTPLGQLAALPIPRQSELAAYAKRVAGMPDASPLVGNRDFWDSDYMVHQRPAFLATVKLISNRMQNAELVNGEGLRSQNLSYGTTFIYQSGNEYDNIFPVWDWRRVPGTTTEQLPEAMAYPPDPKVIGASGKTTFDGGVSDGIYGLAVLDLAQGNVTGHKAYFTFDSGLYCLGAGLNSPTPNPLVTAVNQCLLQSDVVASGQNGPLANGYHSLDNTNWVWQGNTGYVFPGGAKVSISNGAKTGQWSDMGAGSKTPVTKNVFSLWLDHGANAAGASYAYGVIPGCPQGAVLERAAPYEIVQNTPDLQAMRDRNKRLIEAAFWKAGTLTTADGTRLSVDQPCLAIAQTLENGHLRLTLSNPDHKALTVQVTLNGKYSGTDSSVAGNTTVVTVALPETGESVEHELTPQ